MAEENPVQEILKDILAREAKSFTLSADEIAEGLQSRGISYLHAIDEGWVNFEGSYPELGWEIHFLGRGFDGSPSWDCVRTKR